MERHSSHDDRKTEFTAANSITFGIATITLCLRLFSRYLRKSKIGWDDILIFASLGAAIAYLINQGLMEDAGLGRHGDYGGSTSEYGFDFMRRLFLADVMFSVGITMFKLSVVGFYYRVFSFDKRNRIPLLVFGLIAVAWLLIRVVILAAKCDPTIGFWNTHIAASCDVSVRAFYIGVCIFHTLMDLVLLGVPYYYIRKVTLARNEQIVIGILFGVGGLVVGTTIANLVIEGLINQGSTDPTWSYSNILLWWGVEMNLSVVAANLPALQPVFLFVRRKALGYYENGPSIIDKRRVEEAFRTVTEKSGFGGERIESNSDLESSGSNLANDPQRPNKSLDALNWREGQKSREGGWSQGQRSRDGNLREDNRSRDEEMWPPTLTIRSEPKNSQEAIDRNITVRTSIDVASALAREDYENLHRPGSVSTASRAGPKSEANS